MIPRVLGRLIRYERAVDGFRELGPGAEILVEPGQPVEPETALGSTKTGSRVVRLPLNEGELASAMVLKRPGETVRRGEPLLRRASFFGLGNTEFLCPVDGYVEEILVPQRAILIRELTSDVRAGVSGTVTSTLPDRGVTLRFDGTVMRFFAGWGPPVAGVLRLVPDLFSPADVARNLDETYRGEIVWACSTLCAEAILEAARLEVAGLLAGSVSLIELQRAAGELRQLTGRIGLPLTLVISESFGSAAMSPVYRRQLAAAVGRAVYLDPGSTADHGWARDPEIAFSPHEGATDADAEFGERSVNCTVPALVPGLRVRVVDLDAFGKQGVLVAPSEAVELETGVVVDAVEVLLEDGERVKVPTQNVELVEVGNHPAASA